jgi:hypothetical protein
VELTELIEGLLDQLRSGRPVCHVARVCHRFATGGLDLLYDSGRNPSIGSVTMGIAAKIIDDDPGAFAREQEGMLTADAVAGSGDDHNPTIQCTHWQPSIMKNAPSFRARALRTHR